MVLRPKKLKTGVHIKPTSCFMILVCVLLLCQFSAKSGYLDQLKYTYYEGRGYRRSHELEESCDMFSGIVSNSRIQNNSVVLSNWELLSHIGLANLTQMRSTSRIVYNRVPKCGSTTTWNLIKHLSEVNNFFTERSEQYHEMLLSPEKQNLVVKAVSGLTQPFLFERHLNFIDFSLYGYEMPLYINLVRDPVARFVSNYYYERQVRKENFTPEEYNQTINTCVEENRKECTLNNSLLVIPFFCGHDPICQYPNNEALVRAKENVIKYYGVVGLTEEYFPFLEVLGCVFPQYFKCITKMYKKRRIKSLLITKHKDKISPQNKLKLKKSLTYEYEFYDFLKQRFLYFYNKLKPHCQKHHLKKKRQKPKTKF